MKIDWYTKFSAPNASLRVLNLGWGVQSFTLAAMVAKLKAGELPAEESERLMCHFRALPDLLIHADTHQEIEATYAFAERWTPYLLHCGLDVRTVRGDDVLAVLYDAESNQTHAPLYTLDKDGKRGVLHRSCTDRVKIAPNNAEVKREMVARGFAQFVQRGTQTRFIATDATVERWIGISWDEWDRAKYALEKWSANRYPLLELGMTRADCERWLVAHGFEVPPKSKCKICPYQNRRAWQEQKRNGGTDWDAAVRADEASRNKRPGYRTFLHQDCIPLVSVRLPEESGMAQSELEDSPCDAEAGCFL